MDRGQFLKVLGLTTASTITGGLSGIAKAVNKDNPSGGIKTQEAVVDKPVTAIVIGAGARGTT